jgi:hypothetical protein
MLNINQTPAQPATDLVQRLRNTPNWQRQSFAHWKSATLTYDRAPFEAADEIERQATELAALRAERDALRVELDEAVRDADRWYDRCQQNTI